MKTLFTILLATLCAATSYAQTMKALSYNSTNDTIVATQRVTFSALGLATGSAAAPSLTYAVGTNVFGTFATTQLGIGPYLGFSVNGTRQFYIATNTIRAELPISFANTTNEATTRTNLGLPLLALTNANVTNFREAIGLPLPALTNTSNVTTMRALAGSTNTNQPYSGLIQYADSPTGDIWEMTVSNGIILKIEMQ
jgi:hypothetical protein